MPGPGDFEPGSAADDLHTQGPERARPIPRRSVALRM